jgi:hypothetical protein
MSRRDEMSNQTIEVLNRISDSLAELLKKK